MRRSNFPFDKKKPLEEQLDRVRIILRYGKVEDVKELVKRGLVKVNIYLGDNDSDEGFTPLHYAASNTNIEVFKYLAKTLQLNPDDGDELTPLLVAAHHGNFPVIKLLIQACNVDASRRNGFGQDVIGILDSQYHFKYIEPVKRLIARQSHIALNRKTPAESNVEAYKLKYKQPVKKIISQSGSFFGWLFSSTSKVMYEEVPLLKSKHHKIQ